MSDYEKVLDLPMGSNDANATTVRAYLKSLLSELWRKEESFSGKRPFGNSGWQSDVWAALVSGGLCPGTLDEDGYVQEIDQDKADVLVQGAIASL